MLTTNTNIQAILRFYAVSDVCLVWTAVVAVSLSLSSVFSVLLVDFFPSDYLCLTVGEIWSSPTCPQAECDFWAAFVWRNVIPKSTAHCFV